MLRRLLRVFAVVALLGATTIAATTCATACPAIGYLNLLAVDVSAFPDAADIQFCVGVECSPAPGDLPTSSTNLYAATAEDDGTWSLAFGMDAPETIEIRLFDAQGTVIHESEQAIGWTHSDATCGGPSTADPLVLSATG